MNRNISYLPFSKAFTLIELSIVLVIVGLLVAGVTQGRSLITSARIRSQIAQINDINTATTSFRAKYEGLPGDLYYQLADKYIEFTGNIGDGTVGQGNGDGIISSPGSGSSYYFDPIGEIVMFWKHLKLSGMLENVPLGSNVTYANSIPANIDWVDVLPGTKFGDRTHLTITAMDTSNSTGSGSYNTAGIKNIFHFIVLSRITDNQWSADFAMAPALTTSEAFEIDRKIDDGIPTTGTVRGWGQSATNRRISNIYGAAEADQCGTSEYFNIGSAVKMCNLLFMLQE